MLFLANFGSNTISVINGDNTNAIVKNIPVGEFPSSVAVNPKTNTVYVANSGSNTVSPLPPTDTIR
jgi:YVTN family beta-propeller protein